VLCRTVCDTDLDAVAGFCPLMEQLDILGTREVSPGAVQRYLITSDIQCSLVTVNKRAALVQWWVAGMVICLERGADFHIAQLMPLPLTVSCFSKVQISFTFLVLAHPGSPGQMVVKRVCVCGSVNCHLVFIPVEMSLTALV